MPRIVGVDIPKEKRIDVALTYIHGIGPRRSLLVLKETGIKPSVRAKDLTPDEVGRISEVLSRSPYPIEGDLRREVQGNIKRLISIHSYRGQRHTQSLPVRGQRTHTNARTRKGPRRATVALKRKVTK
ncbi:MAG: 30S ribosomal protein S13 [Verrucomicrobia bacterium]|nr:30S ribosomal protein S13 [Verrucomicrobiota bacterium]